MRTGSSSRVALAAVLALLVLLANPATGSAAGTTDPRSVGETVRQVAAQRIISTPLRLTVTVAGQTKPAAVVLVRAGGDQRVTVLPTPWPGRVRVVVTSEELDGRVLIVNETDQSLTIVISRGRTTLLVNTLDPHETLSVRLGSDDGGSTASSPRPPES